MYFTQSVQTNAGDNEVELRVKYVFDWVRTSNPVIRSPLNAFMYEIQNIESYVTFI